MRQYCSYNGTAIGLNKNGVDLLSVYCPHYKNENVETCCDEEQVLQFED